MFTQWAWIHLRLAPTVWILLMQTEVICSNIIKQLSVDAIVNSANLNLHLGS